MERSRLRIPVVGLPCAAGDRLPFERALARVPGVVEAYLNPADESAYLTVDATRFRLPSAIEAIERLGGEVPLRRTTRVDPSTGRATAQPPD